MPDMTYQEKAVPPGLGLVSPGSLVGFLLSLWRLASRAFLLRRLFLARHVALLVHTGFKVWQGCGCYRSGGGLCLSTSLI